MIIKLSVPTWLYVNQQHINLVKYDCLYYFSRFLLLALNMCLALIWQDLQ